MNPYESLSEEYPRLYEAFEQLNDYQKAAVTDDHKVTLLNAHVGSGKTTVILHKVLYLHLIKQIPLEKIFVMTFTNKAAREIRQRLKGFGVDYPEESVRFIGTFHAIAKALMKEHLPVERLGYTKDFEGIDMNRFRFMVRDEAVKQGVHIKSKYFKGDLTELRQGEHIYPSTYYRQLRRVLKVVKQRKIEEDVMDFDDLIDNVIRLLKRYKSRKYCGYILVDEFQDSDERQIEFIQRLSLNKVNIFAVGDPNQSIYEWRGGYPFIFDSFGEEMGAYKMSLPVNYRSSSRILEYAKRFCYRRGEEITGVREEGVPVIVRSTQNEYADARYIAEKIAKLIAEGLCYSDIAILFRKNVTGEVFEKVLKDRQIPYEFYTIAEDEEKSGSDLVRIMTLHSCKGLEFKYVFISGVNEGLIPMTDRDGDYDYEEMRLYFVGLTRAKDVVELSWYERSSHSGYYVEPKPSRFLKSLPR